MMHHAQEQRYDGVVKVVSDALGQLTKAWFQRLGQPNSTDPTVSTSENAQRKLLAERGHLVLVSERLSDAQIAIGKLLVDVERERVALGPSPEDLVDLDNA